MPKNIADAVPAGSSDRQETQKYTPLSREEEKVAISIIVHWTTQLAKVKRAPSFRGEGDTENVQAIARETALSPKEVERCLALPQHQMFIRSVPGDNEQAGLDMPTRIEDSATALMRKEEADLPARLPTRHLPAWDAKILLSRYGSGGPEQTLEQLAVTHGVSKETIRVWCCSRRADGKKGSQSLSKTGNFLINHWIDEPLDGSNM